MKPAWSSSAAGRLLGVFDGALRSAAVFLIGLWQGFSASHRFCRFEPSCSEYGRQAFQRYPFLKAFFLTATRILRCHPFHPGGYDPLP